MAQIIEELAKLGYKCELGGGAFGETSVMDENGKYVGLFFFDDGSGYIFEPYHNNCNEDAYNAINSIMVKWS